MTKDDKKTEVKAAPAAPPVATTPAKPDAPELTRVEYTGQTAGSIRTLEGQVLVRHVEPGDVIEPADDKERKALIDSGHFVLTRHRATTDTTTDAETRRIAEDAKEQE